MPRKHLTARPWLKFCSHQGGQAFPIANSPINPQHCHYPIPPQHSPLVTPSGERLSLKFMASLRLLLRRGSSGLRLLSLVIDRICGDSLGIGGALCCRILFDVQSTDDDAGNLIGVLSICPCLLRDEEIEPLPC